MDHCSLWRNLLLYSDQHTAVPEVPEVQNFAQTGLEEKSQYSLMPTTLNKQSCHNFILEDVRKDQYSTKSTQHRDALNPAMSGSVAQHG